MNRKPISIGIIGTGGRGMSFARGILQHPQEATLVALCDENPQRMEMAREILGVDCALFRDYRQLLRWPEVEAVMIATPDYTHEEIAVATLGAGKHALCEKPLAITTAGCRRIIQAAEEAGKLLEVGFVLRYLPVCERVREIVQRGDLGTPRLLELSDHYHGGSSYFRRWNRLSRYSGGLLIHKGCHDFDLLNWILGRPPTHVAAFAGVNVFVPDASKGERCLTCMVRCPEYMDITQGDTGKLFYQAESEDGYIRDVCLYNSEKDTHDSATVILDYGGQARAVYSECFHPGLSGRRLSIFGDQAELIAEDSTQRLEVIYRYTGERVVHTFPPASGGHGGSDERQLESFLAALHGRGTTRASGEAGLLSVAVGEAAELSRRTKRIVPLAEVLEE